MKKPKVSLDGAKIQGFFIQHVEKLLLAIVIGLSIFLVYKGFSVTGLESTQSPQGLLSASDDVKKFIDDPMRWTNEIEKTRVVNMPIEQLVIDSLKDTDPTAYYLANAWSRPDFPKLSPRTDPALFPPEQLKVVGIIGPLATVDDGSPDPLEIVPDEDAEPAKPKTKKKAKPKNDILDSSPAGMAMPRAKPVKKPRGGAAQGDPSILDTGPPPEGMVGGAPAGMPGSMNFGGSSSSTAKINPESIQGFAATQGTKAAPAQALVVMAVVPYQKQLEEFQNALANSLDYDPVRDTPTYLLYLVERADVTDDPAADPASLKWTRLGVNAALQEARTTWVGALGEVVDLRYIEPPQGPKAGLTHPAPPFMQRDSWELLTHPAVPLAPLATTESETLGPGGRPVRPTRPGGSKVPVPEDVPLLGPGADSAGGSSFSPSASSAAMPVMPGMGPAGMPGASAYGSSAYGSSGYADPASLEPPKYKLIRFTDMSPEVGRKYRYRLKVIVHDPNHPSTGYTRPSPPSLDPKVQERLKKVDPKVFYVESEWSAPSAVASLPDTNRFFAGAINATKSTTVVEGKPSVPIGQPDGNALVVVWDSAKVVDVPAQTPVYRGSVLNFEVEETQVIHPVNHMAVPLQDYKFSTDALVADMQGGDEIPLLDKRKSNLTPLKAPSELLIFDAAGNLHVRDEIEDVENFRVFLVPEAPVVEESASSSEAEAGSILEMPMPGAAPRGKRSVTP